MEVHIKDRRRSYLKSVLKAMLKQFYWTNIKNGNAKYMVCSIMGYASIWKKNVYVRID